MAAVTLIVTLSATGASAAVSERGANFRASSSPEMAEASLEGNGREMASRSETCRDACGGGDARAPYQSNGGTILHVTRPACADARRGLAYYIRRTNEWRHKMGAATTGNEAPTSRPGASTSGRPLACPQIRRSAKLWRSRAQRARLAYEAWSYQWEWQRWLPDKFRRVGHCETGSTPGGTAAGNWRWDSGRYVSAFGIYRPAYESYHRWTGRNTPREQYEVAAAIQARFGWGAWGCGNA